LSEDSLIKYSCDKKLDELEKIEIKKEIYSKYKNLLENQIIKEVIFLSEVDLENDLDKVLNKEVKIAFLRKLGKKYENNNSFIKYLQKSKKINMVQFVEFVDDETLKKIYEGEQFSCLKKLIEKLQ